MKAKLLALVFLVGGSVFAGPRLFVGVNLGGYYPGYYAPPPPLPPVYYARPAYVRPGFTWISGYWEPYGPRYTWRPGYWARPPYVGAYWVAPRYYGRRYYRGFWR